jgi:hypothetical protein
MSQASPASTPIPEKPNMERSETNKTETDNFNPSLFNRNFSASPVASVTSDTQRSTTKAEDRKDTFSNFGPPSAAAAAAQDIPGAFPRDAATPLQQNQTGESSMNNLVEVRMTSTPPLLVSVPVVRILLLPPTPADLRTPTGSTKSSHRLRILPMMTTVIATMAEVSMTTSLLLRLSRSALALDRNSGLNNSSDRVRLPVMNSTGHRRRQLVWTQT